jgi:hypothetical protein
MSSVNLLDTPFTVKIPGGSEIFIIGSRHRYGEHDGLRRQISPVKVTNSNLLQVTDPKAANFIKL